MNCCDNPQVVESVCQNCGARHGEPCTHESDLKFGGNGRYECMQCGEYLWLAAEPEVRP